MPWPHVAHGCVQVRLRSLVRQLSSWAEQFPKARMSVGELRAVGKFVDLRAIVQKAVSFADEAVSAFELNPTVTTALAVRDAAIFGMTGGDGCGPLLPPLPTTPRPFLSLPYSPPLLR